MTATQTFKSFSLAALGVATTVLAGSLAAGAAPAPTPAPAPDAIVAARVAGFKKMGGAMKALNEQLKSAAPDTAVMVAAATTLAATAREQAPLFPEGSGPSSGVKTDALPNIWTDRATFDALLVKLAAESDKLVTVASGGDPAATAAQLKATGAVCGACHRQFRADT